MLAVLVGIINRTNWKKPNTQRGSFSITVQDSEHLQHTKRGRKEQNLCALSFCHIPKGKKKTQRATRTTQINKTRQEDKQSTANTERQGQKQGQREKNG